LQIKDGDAQKIWSADGNKTEFDIYEKNMNRTTKKVKGEMWSNYVETCGWRVRHWYGYTGIGNFVIAFIVQVAWFPQGNTQPFLLFAWVLATVIHEIAWGAMIVVWIMTMFVDLNYSNIQYFADVAEIVKYGTLWSMYGVNALLILIATALDSGSPETWIAWIFYLGVAGWDSFVQIYFEWCLTSWKDWALIEMGIQEKLNKNTFKKEEDESMGIMSWMVKKTILAMMMSLEIKMTLRTTRQN